MGSEADLRTLIGSVRQHGIRILSGAVMSHTGYATLADIQEYQFGALYLSSNEVKETPGERWSDWKPTARQTWHSFNDYINFNDRTGRDKWRGKDWIRTDVGDYDNPGFDNLTMSLAFLPDIKTEPTTASGLPVSYKNKADTHVKVIEGPAPHDYLTHWLSQWVRGYGIDGFRVDTTRHVELPAWQQLKTEASIVLREWKKASPDKALDDKPFQVTGEVWGRGAIQSDCYRHSFNAMINFDHQEQVAKAVDCLAWVNTT